jgi:hypothetical protein
MKKMNEVAASKRKPSRTFKVDVERTQDADIERVKDLANEWKE